MANTGTVKYRLYRGHEQFIADMYGEGSRYGEETMRTLLVEIKKQIPAIIDANRKTPKGAFSPVGYTQGKLGRSVRFRIRKWNIRDGVTVRGYLSVGEGLPYAHVHDRSGTTTIRAKTPRGLVFYDHIRQAWMGRGPVKVHHVEREGSPYFDEAVSYSMAKLGL